MRNKIKSLVTHLKNYWPAHLLALSIALFGAWIFVNSPAGAKLAKAFDSGNINFGYFACVRHGYLDATWCPGQYSAVNWQLDPNNHQLYHYEVSVDYHGHGTSTSLENHHCISTVPYYLSGICHDELKWNGNPSDGVWRLWYTHTRTLTPDNIDDYGYVTMRSWVEDAEMRSTVILRERSVEIIDFDPGEAGDDYVVTVGEPFTICWATDSATRGVTFSWEGSIGSGGQDLPEDYCDYYTINAAGDVTYRLNARGQGGTGGREENREFTITAVSVPITPNPSPTPSPTPTPVPNPTGGPACNDGATVSIAGIPANVFPGQTVPFTVTVQDTGNTMWYHGDVYRLMQRSGFTINPSYGHLPYGFVPGTSATWNFELVAPVSTGTYAVEMQMKHLVYGPGDDYVLPTTDTCPFLGPDTWFGQIGAAMFNVVIATTYPPTVNIDVPASMATVSGIVHIGGWAIDNPIQSETAIGSVSIDISGTPVVTSYGPRPDVCVAFPPARPGCPNVGWGTNWDTRLWPNGLQSINVTATDGQGASSTVSRLVNVNNLGTAYVTTNYAGGTWRVNGTGGPYNGTGTSGAYGNLQAGNYTLSNYNVAGYTAVVTGALTQSLSAGGSVSWTIDYTLQAGGVNASTNNASGTWTVRDSANAVVGTGTGTTVQTLNLPVGNYTFHVSDLAAYNENVRVNGGTTNEVAPYSFTVVNGGNVTLLGYYWQTPPNGPSNVQLEVSPCGQLRFSWLDNNNLPAESGFTVYYRNSAGGANNFIANVPGTLAGTGTRGYYTWTTPPATPVWIAVDAYIDYGGTLVHSPVAVSASSFTRSTCNPDMSGSNKTISHYQQGGSGSWIAFNGEQLQNGDSVRFRIIIQNSGNANVTINNIADVLRPNNGDDGIPMQLAQPSGGWNLRVDKDGDGNYNEVGETGSISGSAPNLTINISGTKCTTSNNNSCSAVTDPSCQTVPVLLCNNWAVTFEADIASTDTNVRTEFWNEADINFTFAGVPDSQHVETIHYLLQTGRPRVPQFREIAP